VWSASYDDNGNPLVVTDSSGTSTFTYDDANRIETAVRLPWTDTVRDRHRFLKYVQIFIAPSV
jgi:YD repeat-containing protein